MNPPKWFNDCPDFSNRDVYEDNGWIKTGKFDLTHKSNLPSPWQFSAIGTTPRLEKVATVTAYENEDLDLKAQTVDFFDQGIVFVHWGLRGKGLINLALKKENHWILNEKNEEVIWLIKYRDDGTERKIIQAITLNFFKSVRGKHIDTLVIRIERED